MYSAYRSHANASPYLALDTGAVSIRVDSGAFQRMLWERCMTGEELRRELGLSPSTLAKFNNNGRVRDDVFAGVVRFLERRPVSRVAQELAGVPTALGRTEEAVG
jgi:hypothetical protein